MPTHKFWVVSVDGNPQCSKRHDSLESAEKEAARLAIKEGNRVYILEAVRAVRPSPTAVAWEDATDPQPKETP